ncbi:CPBP family intramembrane metalloprotease [Horticoccus luteus]|uniref:CPBP family intramembrane metalloprotease n=1 Tax=Horticoccus luteus TaxID=2862869 RepID=A0A8F9TWK4_9BACT|nr:CPBP family intramembrane glutamic endopeptidase [Horticoccus luteus]QYM80430.1 CPBP family intramembrane metalloprotease [Horticoccus luteus]
MAVPFMFLAAAIVSLWAGGETSFLRRRGWFWFWALALLTGLQTRVLDPLAFLWIAGFAAAACGFASASAHRGARLAAAAAVLLLAAALMLHRLPGFHNPRVLDAVRFTPDAVPFTLYLNFDKVVVGLLLLRWCHPRIGSFAEWRTMLAATAPRALGVMAVVLGVSLVTGYVRWAPKVPAATALWLGVNLLFTCMAEEAVFRGFVQAQLQRLWGPSVAGRWFALVVAAALFGLAHAAGGAVYVFLATIAGLGYGWIYLRTGRIEASILAHFALNTVHFFAFTYPALQHP